jgi:hypothetical protein
VSMQSPSSEISAADDRLLDKAVRLTNLLSGLRALSGARSRTPLRSPTWLHALKRSRLRDCYGLSS